MINFLMHHKIIVIAIALVVAIMVWYGLSSSADTSSSLLSTQSVEDSGPDKDLVATLLALRAVKLDAALFTEPAFTSLKDFSTQIVPEPIGRPNPFAPLGASALPSASSTKSAQIFNPGSTKNGGR